MDLDASSMDAATQRQRWDGCRCSFCETFKVSTSTGSGKPGSFTHSFSLTDLLDVVPCSFCTLLYSLGAVIKLAAHLPSLPRTGRRPRKKRWQSTARDASVPDKARTPRGRYRQSIASLRCHPIYWSMWATACCCKRCRHRHMPGSPGGPGGPGVSVPMGALGWLSFFRLSRLFFASLYVADDGRPSSCLVPSWPGPRLTHCSGLSLPHWKFIEKKRLSRGRL